ncbi:hypothetical protein KR50_02270 [Jeotgalibacillus campisalis]|uniref:Uncharacterized protein n=1 Tax=Jeotgalibacillus campisalis TaxID=220754 RepID=A0A0C2WA17_9BACL|nr:hypothetical protein KR50_02270 [Jeotgalibacillus campisalis]
MTDYGRKKEALEAMYDKYNLTIWKIIYGNLQEELYAEQIITLIYKDIWECDQVLFSKERQLIMILRFCRNRLDQL